MADEYEHNYGLALEDVDGFTMSGATRKVASGNKIILGKYTMTWNLKTDVRAKHNISLNSANTYSKHLPYQSHTGIEPRTFTVNCAIVNQDGLDFAPSGYQRLDFPTLQDLLFFNHRYYVTDYWGTDTGTESPIYQLMNESTSLYYTLYSSQAINTSKGLPVILKGISGAQTSTDGGVTTFKMELVEDTGEDT